MITRIRTVEGPLQSGGSRDSHDCPEMVLWGADDNLTQLV